MTVYLIMDSARQNPTKTLEILNFFASWPLHRSPAAIPARLGKRRPFLFFHDSSCTTQCDTVYKISIGSGCQTVRKLPRTDHVQFRPKPSCKSNRTTPPDLSALPTRIEPPFSRRPSKPCADHAVEHR